MVDNPPIEWETLSLSCVEYPKSDLIGKFLSILSLSPLFLSIALLTYLYCRRDTYTILFSVGLCINYIINYGAKIIIKQPRPPNGPGMRAFTEYGMPSLHAQFTAFFITFLLLAVTFRWKLHYLWKFIYSLGLISLLVGTCISRVYLQYHSISQVLVGSVGGGFIAVNWFIICNRFISRFNRLVLRLWISKYFYIRQLSHFIDYNAFEYNSIVKSYKSTKNK